MLVNKNSNRKRQFLQIDIASEDGVDQENEQMDDYQQQEDESDYESQQDKGNQGTHSDQSHQQQQISAEVGNTDDNDQDCDDLQQQNSQSQQEQSQFLYQNQQQSSFNQQSLSQPQQSITQHTFTNINTTQRHNTKYKLALNQQQYLIVDNQNHNYTNNSLVSYPQPATLSSQQNDHQVQKIIQEVLYKRRHKQKQQQLISNIINSQTNHQSVNYNIHNQLNNSNALDPTFKNEKKPQSHHINSYQSLIKKCKQIQTKINKMNKKQLERQKLQSNKQSFKQKQHKQMSKRQLSLQKLKKRLEKALNLNQSLAKRVKLQKSQLISISIMNSRSHEIQQLTINQESSIKGGTQNSSLIGKSNGQKCYMEDTFRQCSKNSYRQLSSVGLSREKRLCAKKAQKSKQKQKKAATTNKNIIDLDKNKTSSSVAHQRLQSVSSTPTIYKSPILQFNSYLIDESQYKSPAVNKQNIYIEDDMNSFQYQHSTQSVLNCQNNQENQKLFEELKGLMGKYLALEIEEKSLQQRVESNSVKIKEYENEHYQQIVRESV